ncbi:phenylalanine--tRNA ligase subunit beta [Methylocella sp.]|uniref:phenylalanine--tRNA ligase subunit beta n=1 Tax=Methylocella sp. TaxID=1978226 RepID=UPI0035B4A3C3
MKFTLSWLKDHLETGASLEEVVETLTRIGLEVEHVGDPAAALKDFRVARIVEAAPHPNADRLRVCQVDVGAGALVQVVCGAPNARAGLKTVFAPPGAVIPASGATLARGVIRGVESAGMLCSGAELGLSDAAEGIMELGEDAPVGAPFAQAAGLDDPVVDFNLLPNRPDAMGVEGVARDLAAAGLGRFKGRAVKPVPPALPAPAPARLDFAPDEARLAPAFALRLICGVRNGPSPDWLARRLRTIGLRPINALVDVTNYLAFDRARPLHVFDARKIAGELVVRRARAGESLAALDGRTYALDPETVVIADETGPLSIGGIMGGASSGCDGETVDVLVESALWDPVNIARTGRRLSINSDARYRFERGVDPAFLLPGLELATALILAFCGGEPSAVTLSGRIPESGARVAFAPSEVERLAGLKLPEAEVRAILERLGFALSEAPDSSGRLAVTAPSFRPDVEGPADLVEEVVRIAGLERVASTPFPRAAEGVGEPALTPAQRRVSSARRALAASGLVEAVTWSFVPHAQAQAFGGGAPELRLSNPIAADLSDMRPSLMPGLVAAARRNADRGHGDAALFEVGQIFRSEAADGQKTAACALRQGSAKISGTGRSWMGSGAVDAFDAKADALALLGALGVPVGALQVVPGGPDHMHPGRSGRLQLGPKTVLGYFGELHPRVLELLDAQGPLVGFEIVLDDIPSPKSRPTRAKPKLELIELMPVRRDFAFVVEKDVPAGEVLKAALSGDRTLISGAELFDVYEGAGVAPGRKSVGVCVTLQPREKTLTEADIEAAAGRIVAEVARRTGASLRG